MSAIITERAKSVAEWRQAEKEGKLGEEINHPDCACGKTCLMKDKDDDCWDCDCDGECDCDCVNPFFWKLCDSCLYSDICETCGENTDAGLIDGKLWCHSCREKDEERDLSVPVLIPVPVVIDLTEEPVITYAGSSSIPYAPDDMGLNQDVNNWLEFIREECNVERVENKDNEDYLSWVSSPFPIETIDGIMVDVSIRAYNNEMLLIIESDHILDGEGNQLIFNKILLNRYNHPILRRPMAYENGEEIQLLDFQRSFIKMNEVLREIKFDKVQCSFEDKQTTKEQVAFYGQQHKMELALACVFENNTNLKERKRHCQECSVCYEKTKTLTACNHSLCVCCWDKLAEVVDDDVTVRKCPICREDLYIK